MKDLKNVYSYKEFLNEKNNLNEGLFSFIGKLFKKAQAAYKKVKGGQKVKDIYDKYIDIINQEMQKQAQVTLNLGGILSENLNEEVEAQDPVVSQEEKTIDDKNKKMTPESLKKKQIILKKIIDTYKQKALKEMDQVLSNMGGAEKNPKLKIIIDNQKDQFTLDFMDAEIKFLEQAGDKESVKHIASERDKLAKDLDVRWNLDKVEHAQIEVNGDNYKIGVPYRYDKTKTIKISSKIDDKNDVVMATYVSDKFGEIKEQPFRVSKIDKEFKPKAGTYSYFSKSNNDLIDVTVEKNPKITPNGIIEVTNGAGKKINVYVGSLVDKE